MLKRYPIPLLLILGLTVGCEQTQKPETAQTVQPGVSTTTTIKPGLYLPGAEHDRIQNRLGLSDAFVGLDANEGIQWYESETESWTKIDDINDIQVRLMDIQQKNLLHISTGKASWDKEEEYVKTISGFAQELGFKQIVVTTDSGQYLSVSGVIE